MEYLVGALAVLILVAIASALPVLLARRGVGSRWVWLGGGIGALLALVLYFIVWDMAQKPVSSAAAQEPASPESSQRPPSSDVVEFKPTFVCGPLSTPLGGAEVGCILCGLGFVIAGICCKPKKKTETSVVGGWEGEPLRREDEGAYEAREEH